MFGVKATTTIHVLYQALVMDCAGPAIFLVALVGKLRMRVASP